MARPETHKYVPLNLSLTPEFAELIQEKMDTGFYTSQAEVVRDALRKMELCDRLIYDLQISVLKDMLKPNLKDAVLGQYQDYSLEELIKLKPRAPFKRKTDSKKS